MSVLPDPKLYVKTDSPEVYHQRPVYPDALFQQIREYTTGSKTGRLGLAVDVCCGTGESTWPLAQFSDKVVGVDLSTTMLDKIKKRDVKNVEFKIGNAYELSKIFEPSSVDLVTVGVGLHFLDLKKFYKEVDIILKPGGALIPYSIYLMTRMKPDGSLELSKKFIAEMRAPYDDPYFDNFMVDYKLELEYPGWTKDKTLSTTKILTPRDYVEFLKSIAEFAMFDKDHPERKIFEDMESKLTALIEEEKARNPSYQGKMEVTWPIVVLKGRKPRL